MNHFWKKIHEIVFGRVKFEPKTYKNYNISKTVLKSKSYSEKLILSANLYGEKPHLGFYFLGWEIFNIR